MSKRFDMVRKSVTVLTLLFFYIPALLSQAGNRIAKDPATGRELLYGEIDTAALSHPPFSEWYTPGYNSYVPDTQTIVRLINNKAPEYHYVIVMGTWCPDSRREVPRMMKVLFTAGVPESVITIYAVDRDMKARRTPVRILIYKKCPLSSSARTESKQDVSLNHRKYQ